MVAFEGKRRGPLFSTRSWPRSSSPAGDREKGGKGASAPLPGDGEEDQDELFPAAVDVVLETGQASVSLLQRRLKLAYHPGENAHLCNSA